MRAAAVLDAARSTIRKNWYGLDRADGEVVVAVLRVVEVEAAEPADHRQAAHDLLDVRVRQVVAEVDEALRALTRRLREQQRRAPVGVDASSRTPARTACAR